MPKATLYSDPTGGTSCTFVHNGEIWFYRPPGDSVSASALTSGVTADAWVTAQGYTVRGQTIREVGVYHPRIWRPGCCRPVVLGDPVGGAPQQEPVTQSVVASELLERQLREVFDVVEPCASTLTTHGHAIRNLHLLACMEIESACRDILTANQFSYTPPATPTNPTPTPVAPKKWDVNIFHRLAGPLSLADYEVSLPFYPSLGKIRPFDGWTSGTPPTWWTDYNKTKHHRAEKFALGNLNNAIHSIAAARVMVQAQFGPFPPSDLLNVARLTRFPDEDIYVSLGFAKDAGAWTPAPFPGL